MPDAMKAVVFHEHGGPEVLRYEEIPVPEPGPGQVLFKIRAMALNYNDTWAREGVPGVKTIFPHVSGSDMAGVVEKVGPGVVDVRPGDEVVAHPSISCRNCAACTAGQEYFCRRFLIWGFQTGPNDGSMAEYGVLPVANLLPKPAGIGWEEASSYSLCLLTVWHMLKNRARLQPGEEVLVWGATGGLGIFAVQVARLFGARVLAVVGADGRKEKLAAELGADAVIDHRSEDVVARVKELTGKRGVDVVFEHTGQATWERSIASMAWGARLVICGNTSGWEGKTDLRFLFNKQLNLLGSHEGRKADLVEAWKFVEAGRIRTVIREVLPLREAARAEELFVDRHSYGKIVLVPEHAG